MSRAMTAKLKAILATLVAFTVSPCLAGQVACMAKDTAKILDAPNVNGKVVGTITKQDGLQMFPDGISWLPVKGWYSMSACRPDTTHPDQGDICDIGGYVKADTVRCQLGGHWISPN